MRGLGYVSKANPSLPFLKELRDHGWAAAEAWLRTCLDRVGQGSSFDVDDMLDRSLVARWEEGRPAEAPQPSVPLLPEIAPAKGFG
jgi:hypothetical protein